MRNEFDIVVSNAVLHHRAFPTYMNELHRVLKTDGVCVIGDWYTEVWYRPENVAYILKEGLGADRTKIESFMKAFGFSWPEILSCWENVAPDVKARNEGMLKFVRNLARRLVEKSATLDMIEAHDLVHIHAVSLGNTPECLAAAHDMINSLRHSRRARNCSRPCRAPGKKQDQKKD